MATLYQSSVRQRVKTNGAKYDVAPHTSQSEKLMSMELLRDQAIKRRELRLAEGDMAAVARLDISIANLNASIAKIKDFMTRTSTAVKQVTR